MESILSKDFEGPKPRVGNPAQCSFRRERDRSLVPWCEGTGERAGEEGHSSGQEVDTRKGLVAAVATEMTLNVIGMAEGSFSWPSNGPRHPVRALVPALNIVVG